MNQPDHAAILQAIGRLQGQMDGVSRQIRANSETASAVDAKITALATRIGRIELWKAELRGMTVGARFVAGGIVAFAASTLTVLAHYVLRKFGS